jgi:hypothetical protein
MTTAIDITSFLEGKVKEVLPDGASRYIPNETPKVLGKIVKDFLSPDKSSVKTQEEKELALVTKKDTSNLKEKIVDVTIKCQ